MAISFMEAPLKFQAPGITLPLGLGIGRLIFGVLNKAEMVFGFLMLVSIFSFRPRSKAPVVMLTAVLLILVIETAWLLPMLDERATMVINGTAEPFSNLHFFYIACDAVKVVLLLALGITFCKQNLSPV